MSSRALRSAFTDLHYEEQEVFATGDKVAVVAKVTGNHTGNFFVVPPTGNQISYQAVHMFTIGKNSKIVEHKAIRVDLHRRIRAEFSNKSHAKAFTPKLKIQIRW